MRSEIKALLIISLLLGTFLIYRESYSCGEPSHQLLELPRRPGFKGLLESTDRPYKDWLGRCYLRSERIFTYTGQKREDDFKEKYLRVFRGGVLIEARKERIPPLP